MSHPASFPEKFRPDEDDQLIELVHAHPCLWNMSDPDFKKEKRFIWAEIGRKLTRRTRTGVECKSRWRSIRDYYKKQKKDEKNGVSQIPASKRRQVYWNSLKFLDDVDDEVNALSNVHVEISEDAEDLGPSDFQDCESDICEPPVTSAPTKKRKLDNHDWKETIDGQEEHSEREETLNEDESRQPTDETMNSFSDNFEDELKDKFKQFRDRRAAQKHHNTSTALCKDEVQDEIDLFFKAMAATVKKFPSKLKIITKARVFAVVNELEFKSLELTEQGSN